MKRVCRFASAFRKRANVQRNFGIIIKGLASSILVFLQEKLIGILVEIDQIRRLMKFIENIEIDSVNKE